MRRVHHPGDPDPQKILVVLPTWVGDFVMATPALRAIRRRFADAHITFLTEPNLRDLVRGGDWMNECVEWPPKANRSPLSKASRDLAWDLRRHRFDWAVLLPNSFRAALMARLAGAKRRIGYNRDGRGLLLTDRLPVPNRRGALASDERRQVDAANQSADAEPARSRDAHGCADTSGDSRFLPTRAVKVGKNLPVALGPYAPLPMVEYYAELAEAIGCDRPGDALELFTTADCDESVRTRLSSLGIADGRPLVVLSPGARYGMAKCWSPDRFAGLADRLMESEDATVLVTCGPGEESIAQSIGSAMKREGHVLDSPRLSLGELKSLIKRCDMLVCNDAGPRHLAKAFNVPVVTVFGPTHPQWTATSYEAERIVRIDVDCGPCQQRLCPLGHLDCIMGVTVSAVFDAAAELLLTRTIAASGD